MLGLLFTVLFALGAAGVGQVLLAKRTVDSDPALRFGLGGLAGLAIFGLLTLPIAILPGGTHWGLYVMAVLALAGYVPLVKLRPKFARPEGPWALVILGAVLAGLVSLIGVLAPSDAYDWDTLAYHLAVPKIWLLDGQIHFVSFIHHSNFPLTVDGLFIWGLSWGGESGAKAFLLMYAFFGAVALFGFSRERFGLAAGWWTLLSFIGIPLVIWESGTAYIDVANGLFVGFGILFAADWAWKPERRNSIWLSAIFLGCGAGSKYTGLQTIFAVGLVLFVMSLVIRWKKSGEALDLGKPFLIAGVALAIASPWYVKNVVNTGNPVYPFFYSVFHGKNWDAFSDSIYREQQQTFGTGRPMATDKPYTASPLEPARFGSAVLGLAYEPGRYVDAGPTSGLGFPFASLGVVPMAAMLLWLLSGRMGRFEAAVMGVLLISFAMWFFLSEQARYMLGLAIPLCVLAGAGAARLKAGPLLAGAATIQLLASIVVITRFTGGAENSHFAEKLKVVLGTTSPEDYRKQFVGFYTPAQDINATVGDGRVALFDEVFGFYLDVPYFWANPGHSTEMGWETMQNVDDLMSAFHRLGISYAYINLGETFGGDSAALDKWQKAAGISQAPVPYGADEWGPMMLDPRTKYKLMLAEAIAQGKLTVSKIYGSRGTRILFKVL